MAERGYGDRLLCPTSEEVGENEEVVVQEEQTEESEQLKVAVDPGQPTKKQVEEHRTRGHVPYRSWCRWCNLGRGRCLQHQKKGTPIIPIVGLDYFFLTESGTKTRKELGMDDAELTEARAKGEVVKCIIVRCLKSKSVFSHFIPVKGVDEDGFVVGLVTNIIEWLGYSRIILKSDNEPAIQALVRQSLEMIKVEVKDIEQISAESPPAYDSQANGGTEVGVRIVRGMLRTLKLCLEARINKHIPVSHPVMAWLLEHACLVLTASVRGTDGITAWMRVRGRPFAQQMIGFGESVLYKFPSKGPKHAPQGNVGPLGDDGIFLGFSWFSNTFIVGTKNGVIAVRSVTRKPESDRWIPDDLAGIQDFPGQRRVRAEPERVRFNAGAPEGADTAAEAAPAAPRALRINKSDLEEHGYDQECPQCRHVVKYGKPRPGGQHSKKCRARIVESMRQTEAGRTRLQVHEERLDQATAERLEWAVTREPAAVQVPARAHGFLERRPQEGDPHPRDAGIPPARPQEREASQTTPPESQGLMPGSSSDHAPPPPARSLQPSPSPGGLAREDMGDDFMEETVEGDAGDMEVEHVAHEVEQNFIGSLDHSKGDLGSLEPSVDDVVAQLLVAQMGSTSRSLRREQRAGARRIVSEIYSPARVTKMIRDRKMRHILPGFSFDVTVNDPEDGLPWDFSLKSKRDKARRLLREQRPYMLIGSPMCRHFSTWQALNLARSTDAAAMLRARTAAIVHLDFVASLYEEQMAGGRYFLHEHPRYATSWTVPSIARVMNMPHVQLAHGDQCQYGAEIQDGPDRGRPIMKPSGFLTNSPHVFEALSRRCSGIGGECSRRAGGKHSLCSGRHAVAAAKYPKGLCRAMLRGVRDQLAADGRIKDGCYGVQAEDDDAQVERHLRGPEQGYSGTFRDDLTGQALKDSLVKEARATELAFFHSKHVWVKVPRNEARTRTGRAPISVRWVDVNKGDDAHPNYRSRLVARQLKARDTSGQSYFAPAPPLEALRTVVSMAMTRIGEHQPDWSPDSPTRTQISMVDVKRAYFNATISPEEPPTYVQLPDEDEDAQEMCAKLLRHMYGTRAAADGWQEEYSTSLVALGFRQGEASPNVFHHELKGIVTSVHGDDFTSSGPADALDWLEASIAENYEITVSPRLGPGANDAKEGRVLNRILRWRDSSIEYECDPRQIEKLIAECGLEGAKPVATPGVKATFSELEQDSVDLAGDRNTAFRGAAARGNYLAADRLDVQFACKEVCRWMARPSLHAWKSLKRICRYLVRAPRLVYSFPQQTVSSIDVYTDTDWAGCPKTRKSTSGGVIMLGRHAVKHWSSTQTSTALSSGEAEFAGVIRGAGQGLGYQALLKDVGIQLPLRVWTDSSAAIGICSRQGLGKLRHLDTHTLWIQQAVRTKRVDLRKVLGERNPADLLTKHSISRQRLDSLIELYGCKYLGGRAETAPQTRTGESSRPTMADSPHLLATAQDVEATSDDHDSGTLHGSAALAQAHSDLGSGSPVMPHNEHSTGELDRLYPSLIPPPDEGLDDGDVDARDGVYQHGLALAEQLREKTAAEGRRKRPLAVVQPPEGQPGQPGRPVCGGVTGRDGQHSRSAVVRSGNGDGSTDGCKDGDGKDGSDESGGSESHVVSCAYDSYARISTVCDSILQAFLFKSSQSFIS